MIDLNNLAFMVVTTIQLMVIICVLYDIKKEIEK